MRTNGGTESSGPVDRRSVLQSLGTAGLVGLGSTTVHGGVVPDAVFDTGDGPPLARGTVEQVYVRGATPGSELTLYDGDGAVLQTAEADDFGSMVFEDLEPATGYVVTQTVDGAESEPSDPVEVLPVAYDPPASLYEDQQLEEGFGYLTVRDGVTLAHQVLLPSEHEPPYPTLLIYSGYEPSVSPVGEDLLENHVVEEMGYAVVGVNKRGSTCSGGRFDFGEALQMLDGYDAVETIAAQEWADGVGMIGASYPGFTQLFVAAMQPPSLDAIVPGHPIGNFYRDTVYPGGLRNATFASIWAGDRDQAFEPGGSEGNVDDKIAAGDDICEANQELRYQNESMVDQMRDNEYDTGLFAERDVSHMLGDIEVPTMLVTSWQDEQTGGRSVRLLEQLEEDTTTRFVGTNGDHFEYIGDSVMDDIRRFFMYYVGEEIPPDDDFEDFEEALTAYEDEDPVKIYWEMSRESQPRFETTYGSWPPESVESWSLHFRPDGRLDADVPRPPARETASYDFIARSAWDQLIDRSPGTGGALDWPTQPDGSFVSFVSEPLAEDRVCLGSGLVELWLRAEAQDTALQVTLSEIRPVEGEEDEKEQFVQTGWLRASRRAEDEAETRPRRPYHTHDPADEQPLPDGEFAHMRVELFPFGHTFREGSRIKVAVESPGGNRDLWGLLLDVEEGTNEIGLTESMPSKVTLPLLPDADATVTELPECGTVQNQPCREFDPELSDRWGTISGTVTDGETEPVSALELTIYETGDSENGDGLTDTSSAIGTVDTDADGQYVADLPPEDYDIVVTDSRYQAQTDSATVTSGAETAVDLQVTEADPAIELSDIGLDRDGPLTTGETVSLDVTLGNAGGGTATGIELTPTGNQQVNISPDAVSVEDLGPAATTTEQVTVEAVRGGEAVIDVLLETDNAGDSEASIETTVELPPVVGDEPPLDLDGDGRYENISGDGQFDIHDVQLFFRNLNSEVVQNHPHEFNFSGGEPGEVGIFDVQALFARLQE